MANTFRLTDFYQPDGMCNVFAGTVVRDRDNARFWFVGKLNRSGRFRVKVLRRAATSGEAGPMLRWFQESGVRAMIDVLVRKTIQRRLALNW